MVVSARKLVLVEILRQPPPCLLPKRFGRHHRVDTGERDAAQNEGCDGGDKVHALGQTAGGDAAAVLRHGQNIGKRVATDGVDAAGPTLLAERPRRALQLRPLDDLGRPRAVR